LNDIASALSTCVLKDGTQTITANIPMATFHFTGLGMQPFKTGAALTATGTNQATALQLAANINQVTTTAASTGVILAASPGAGDWMMIYNGGANPLKVYPQTGGTLNGLSTNTGITLAVKTSVIFFAADAIAWMGVLSA
jgi:hypothetical protein